MSDLNDLYGYESLVERLRTGRVPEHGTLTWDGEKGQTAVTIRFDRPGRYEPESAVLERAWRYFRQLTPAEWSILKITIHFRDKLPRWAEIEPREEAGGVIRIGTARLRELEQVLR